MIQAMLVVLEDLAFSRRILKEMHEQKIACRFGSSALRNGGAKVVTDC